MFAHVDADSGGANDGWFRAFSRLNVYLTIDERLVIVFNFGNTHRNDQFSWAVTKFYFLTLFHFLWMILKSPVLHELNA